MMTLYERPAKIIDTWQDEAIIQAEMLHPDCVPWREGPCATDCPWELATEVRSWDDYVRFLDLTRDMDSD